MKKRIALIAVISSLSLGAQSPNTTTPAGARTSESPEISDGTTITLKQEELQVGKKQVIAGGVVLRKVVRTKTINQPVEVRWEELIVERVDGKGRSPGVESGSVEEGPIRIQLLEEVPVVKKEVRIREIVTVGKNVETTRREFSGEIRDEQLQIIKEENTPIETIEQE